MSAYFHLGYPYNTFLFKADDRFMDFFNPLRGSFDLDPYNPERIHFIGGYLPFGYLVSFLFSLVTPWFVSFILFISCFITYLAWYVINSLYEGQRQPLSGRMQVYALVFLTYPVLFAVDRANFDIVIFVFISLFAYFYHRGRTTLATLLLAFPIAMKGYPLVLMMIPLLDKRLKEFVLTGVLVAMLEIISLAVFKDGLVMELGKMLTSFQTAYSIAFEEGSLIRFNSSLYTLLLFLNPSLVTFKHFALGYSLITSVIFLAVAAWMYLKKYPFWRKLLLVILMMILFPQSSGDYRLIMLYPPLLFFLSENEKNNLDRLITFLFALILIPKAYYVFYADVNIGIIINPVLLFLLLVIMLAPLSRKAQEQSVEAMNRVP
jgi:hypothetical protein